jgi:hypothetical protein
MKTWSSQNPLADGPPDASVHSDGRASWYAQGISDAIGDRLLMFDNSGGPSLELLRFSWKLTAFPGFENALRERVELLSQFRHASFAKVRAVERLEPKNDLTLVSNYVSGKRLSDELPAMRGPAFAMWFLRQTVPALASFHQHADGVAHGAITADRIMMTAEGRLVLLEHVLGSALDRLQLSQNELWLRFGLPTAPTQEPVAPVDAGNDVYQLALVALSLLLGRAIATYEYPNHLGGLLRDFQQTPGRELSPTFRTWLLRALRLEGAPFESAGEAQHGFAELEGAVSTGLVPASEAEFPPPAARPRPVPERDALPALTVITGRTTRTRHVEPVQPPAAPNVQRSISAAELLNQHRAELAGRYGRGDGGWRGWAFAAAALIAAGQAGYIGYMRLAQAPTVTIQSPPIVASNAPRNINASAIDWQAMSAQAPAATAPAAADPLKGAAASTAVKAGGLRLVSRIEMQLLDGERVLGSTTDGLPIVTSAGRHEFDLVNSALGYHSRQVFNIKPGEVLSVSIPPPQGKISINAVPWADVWIDGTHIGETPLANLSIPIGQHEVSFRHPSFAEQRRTAIVRYDVPARLSADLR